MQPGTFYHVYNRTNGLEQLFLNDDNYQFFLKKWNQHISPIAETYAYCLVPNHFHFLIRIKDEESLTEILNQSGTTTNPEGFQNLQGFISQQISNCFNSYTKAFNKMYKRQGSLFNHTFKRKEISTDAHLTTIICYIHRNPIHHKFSDINWKYSSYRWILSDSPTSLQKGFVIDWFNGKQNFIQQHNEMVIELENEILIDN